MPEHSQYKVNVNTGWDTASATGGSGPVVRDCHGSVLNAAWSKLTDCASAEEAEVLAVREGLRYLAANAHIVGVIESGCARLVGVLNSAIRVEPLEFVP